MDLLISIHAISALLGFLIAISLLSSRALNPLSARILGVTYLLFFIQHTLAIAVFSDFWPGISVVRALFAMLLGPALYTYFTSVLHPGEINIRSTWLHLLPALLMVTALFFYGKAVDILIIISFFAYSSNMLFQSVKTTASGSVNIKTGKFAKRWLHLLLGMMFVNLFTEIGIVIEISLGTTVRESASLIIGSALFLAFNFLALVLVLTRSPMIEWMHELKGLPANSLPSKLSDEELQTLFLKWQELVKSRELYLTEQGITISRAARLLGIPSRQLSQAINSIYGASFSQYLNDMRVERAKNLLLKDRSTSITAVYLASGFSTKSHFHREFSRIMGMTPSEYRNKVEH